MSHLLVALFCAGALAWGLRVLALVAIDALAHCDATAHLDTEA